MAPSFIPASKNKAYLRKKRTLKYLSICHNPRVQKLILAKAPDDVHKGICNAVLNIAQNKDIRIPNSLKKSLRNKRSLVSKLLSPTLRLKQKRTLIQRGGGAFLSFVLPHILTTAFQLIGNSFFSGKRR